MSVGACAQGAGPPPSPSATLSISDLERAAGNWAGTLTYLDFTSDNEITIPVKLDAAMDGTCLDFAFVFPDEPAANSSDRRCLTRNGSVFDGLTLTSVDRFGIETVFVMVYDGEDNGEYAMKRDTYHIGDDSIRVSTAFRKGDAPAWTQRNRYEFTRAMQD